MAVNMYPQTLEEATAMLRDSGAPPVAGGTDWMPGRPPDSRAVFITGIDALREVQETDGGLLLGACCTLAQLEGDARVPPVLRDALHDMGTPAIRNRGTLGGNIASASPAGDTLPVLYALDARLELHSAYGTRSLSMDAFIQGPGRTALRRGELISRVLVPYFEGIGRFEKVAARRAQAVAKCSFAGFVHLADGGVRDLRLAFGGVGPTVMRSRALEETVIGMVPEFALMDMARILEAYDGFLRPVDDVASTAAYRRKVCLNLLGGFLTNTLT